MDYCVSSFGMEAHMVHYKRIFGNYLNASKEMDGLAIVAVFFMVSVVFMSVKLQQI